MAKLLDTLYNRVIQGKLSLDSNDDLKVVEDAIDDAKPKFELIADLGNLDVTRSGEEGSYEYSAQLSKTSYELPIYDLYIFAMNGSFVITPLAQATENTKMALCVGSFAKDGLGNSMVARLRFLVQYGDSKSLLITFDENFAQQIYDGGITPKAYLFGIKL